MPRELDEIDTKIISVAKDYFLTIGIRKTEMKDIASTANVGRSTLYRHFQNKEDIAFYIVIDILLEIYNKNNISELNQLSSGYRKFERFMLNHVKALIENKNMVKFLDEFDQLFAEISPSTEEAMDFVHFNQGQNNIIYEIFREGMEDGSIKTFDNPSFEVDVFMHMALGLAQRIIPRTEQYIKEHGYSIEYLEEAVHLMLNAIKA